MEQPMTDGPDRVRKGQRVEAVDTLASLANEALKVLAKQRVEGTVTLGDKPMAFLRRSILMFDSRSTDIVQRLRDMGISDHAIIDHYIPETARRLGADWVADRLGFADVTIGSAKLQSMLRELVEEENTKSLRARTAGVAVIVMASDYHTLGAMVLTMQLRRLGISTRLLIGVDFEESLPALRADRFDAVFISASSTKMLSELQLFIRKLRREAGTGTPIVVGGSILGTNDDIKTLTGADFATTDPVEALQLCQLKISKSNNAKAV
jgi:methanogenic corrinoid protein MtbC1